MPAQPQKPSKASVSLPVPQGYSLPWVSVGCHLWKAPWSVQYIVVHSKSHSFSPFMKRGQ